ncbi:MAG: hypothetical protein M1831_000526 [Alyxoria varia]|nr:MAG: hypothetical protein M1831_000526 [Alyxoria varia]
MSVASEISHAIDFRPHQVSFHIQNDSSENRTVPSHGAGPSGATTAHEHANSRGPGYDAVNRRGASGPNEEDLEQQENTRYAASNDPYRLSSKFKNSNEIHSIRTRISRSNSLIASVTRNKVMTKDHRLYNFYSEQNENIERLLTPVDDHIRQAREDRNENAKRIKIARWMSYCSNFTLAIVQVIAACFVDSKSLYATMIDAICDPVSNIILVVCAWRAKRVDPRKFPQGKARIVPAGNIMFCNLMLNAAIVLIAFSIQEISQTVRTKRFDDRGNGVHLLGVIVIGGSFLVKLVLFLVCWAVRNKDPQIQMLWQDHRNDLFVNGIGLATLVIGGELVWWVDPFGAILLSIGIGILWLMQILEEFRYLIGSSAEPNTLQHITYIAITHSPEVVAIDTVRAWHSGHRLIVEVDIVMDAHDTLRETHDVAEALQTKLESLPNVDRAYVHVDYETEHAPEHFLKKEL